MAIVEGESSVTVVQRWMCFCFAQEKEKATNLI